MPWHEPKTFTVGEIATAENMNEQLRDNLLWLEDKALVEFTSDVPITATSEASPDTIVTSGVVAYEAGRYCVEFYCWNVEPASPGDNQVQLNLWDGSTDLGRIAGVRGVGATSSPVYVRLYLDVTADDHEFRVRGIVNAGTGFCYADAGGVGTDRPGYIRVTGA